MLEFIVNPNSRSGQAQEIWKQVESILQEKNADYQVHMTEYAGHATKIAKQLTAILDGDHAGKTLVVLGGDGTVNEVLNGIVRERPVTLGYIPTGSGNDFARSLGINRKIKADIKEVVNEIIHPSHFKTIDYGVTETGEQAAFTGRRFAVSSGIGYDAAVCHSILTSKVKRTLDKIHLTKFAYVVLGIHEIIKTKPVDGYILLENVKKIPLKKVVFVSAHIHPYEGGGFLFAPKADDQDGLLRVCVVSGMGRIKMVPVLLLALFGKHHLLKGVHLYDCAKLSVHIDAGKPVHADGESCGIQQDLHVRCIKKQIRVIV